MKPTSAAASTPTPAGTGGLFVLGLLGMIGAAAVQGLLLRHADGLAAALGASPRIGRVLAHVVGVTLLLPAGMTMVRGAAFGRPLTRPSWPRLVFLWLFAVASAVAFGWLFGMI